MKKTLCTLFALMLVVSGCSQSNELTEVQPSLKAGTYTGSSMGFHDNVTVEVTVDETSIQSVEVTNHAETRFISDLAMNQLPKDIVEQQSIRVDTCTGCTISSRAVLNAVENALKEAGDIAPFKKEKEPIEVSEEEITTDVVVVGGGIAGLSAAITAKENGANVVLVEKLDRVGGSTVESGGILYTTGSVINKELDNDVDALVDYWQMRAEGNADENMLRIAAEGSSETVDKMIEWGVQFSDQVTPSGISDAMRGVYATNDTAEGKPTDGVDFIVPLYEHAKEIGVEILTSTTANELIETEGVITGIKASSDEKNYTIHSDAVILATGGYDLNKEMMKEHSPELADTWAISSPGNTGDGVVMAEKVGAKTQYTGGVIGFKIIDSSRHYIEGANLLGWTGQLGVTNLGTRFGNEAADYPIFCTSMINAKKQGAEKFYLIIDSTTDMFASLAEEAVNKNLGYKAETLEELAQMSGIDIDNLKSTVETYNGHAKAGEPDEYGKTNLVAVEKAPYYAIEIKQSTLGTIGGLVLSENAEVLNENNEPIQGLYAAGEVANSQFFYKEYPASGSSISISGTFGRIAGQSAATYSENK